MHSNIIFFFPKLKIIILFCNSTPVRIRVLVQTTTMMSSRASGSALLRRLGPRLLSVSSAKPAAPAEHWAGAFSARRYASATSPEKKKEEEKGDAVTTGENNKGVVSYWGVGQSKLVKEDGTEWRWNCFKPWDTYKANVEIDLKKHHETKKFQDKLAFWTVKVLRVPTDLFPKRKYGYRCMMLETIAAVPGMVGGMVLHLRSLRRFEHSGGWIRALLEEAENERMHLMTLMEVFKPHWYERTLVLAVQGVFFNAYFLGYLISPRFAHRVVGYLEEEAVHSYTLFLESIDGGLVENVPAPAIAIDYWRLPPDAKLRDALVVIRADEAHHRDVNHYASDIQYQGQQLREVPAPLDYH